MTDWYLKVLAHVNRISFVMARIFGYVLIFSLLMALSLLIISQFLGCENDPMPPKNPAPSLKPHGSFCVDNEDCVSGFCLKYFSDGTRTRGGSCTEACDSTAGIEGADAGCPDEFVCLRYTATQEDYCYAPCETRQDCNSFTGWICRVFPTVEKDYKACVPELRQ